MKTPVKSVSIRVHLWLRPWWRLCRLCAHRASVVNSLPLYRQIGDQDRNARKRAIETAETR
jgi:hypothetical protein